MISSMRRIFSAAMQTVALSTTLTFSVAAANSIPQSFVAEISAKYQLNPEWVTSQLNKATKLDSVLKRISTPWEAKPWHQYQTIFLKQERVDQGIQFWKEHEADLKRAEQTFGVPAQFIVAILGVETYFGRFKGTDKVLDSLYTLGFHYPKRSKFFRSELGHFLALSHEQGWQPETIQGSYAGAMGFSQFISSSYRAYAVDFDKDGKRDLIHSPTDAIGSIANYFAQHGWQRGGCLAEAVALPEQAKSLVQEDTKIRTNWGQLKAAGVRSNFSLAASDKALLFPLAITPEQTQHYLGCNNFYVITRYNHSRLYAMAVYQLSEWLRKERNARS